MSTWLADNFSLQGKKALVTGSSKGIGAGIALAMANVGADLVLVGRSEDSLAHSRKSIEALGQVAVATTPGRLQELRMNPTHPTTRPEVLAALREADWVTMGPGSWFSSVLPHLLVPTLRDAIVASPAKKILLLNLDSNGDQVGAGEYAGYSPREHCEILNEYAPDLRFDLVVADSHLAGRGELAEYLQERGTAYLEVDLRNESMTIHHDGGKLASTFSHIAREMLV